MKYQIIKWETFVAEKVDFLALIFVTRFFENFAILNFCGRFSDLALQFYIYKVFFSHNAHWPCLRGSKLSCYFFLDFFCTYRWKFVFVHRGVWILLENCIIIYLYTLKLHFLFIQTNRFFFYLVAFQPSPPRDKILTLLAWKNFYSMILKLHKSHVKCVRS